MAGVWYVTPARVKVTWGSVVSGGVATAEIHRLRVVAGRPITELWRVPGQAVTAPQLAAAQAEEDAGAVPARETDPQPSTGGGGGLTTEQAAKLAAAVEKSKVPTYRYRDETAGTYPPRESGGHHDEATGTVVPGDRISGDVWHRVVVEP